jgi:hypothetical protein
VRATSLGFGSRVTSMVSFCKLLRVGDRSSGRGDTGDCGLVGTEGVPVRRGCICGFPEAAGAEAAPPSRLAKALATSVGPGAPGGVSLVSIAVTVSTAIHVVTSCLIVF